MVVQEEVRVTEGEAEQSKEYRPIMMLLRCMYQSFLALHDVVEQVLPQRFVRLHQLVTVLHLLVLRVPEFEKHAEENEDDLSEDGPCVELSAKIGHLVEGNQFGRDN